MKVTRRTFLESSATAVAAAGTVRASEQVQDLKDGPATGSFAPLPLEGNADFDSLARFGISDDMAKATPEAPKGNVVAWGIPFAVRRPLVLKGQTVTEKVENVKVEWLVFLHTTDKKDLAKNEQGLVVSRRGQGHLGEVVAGYTIVYADGTEVRETIRRRH